MKNTNLIILSFVLLLVGCNKKDDPFENQNKTIDFPVYFGPPRPEPADNPTTENGVILGRFLFYEKMLSIDTTVSCGSCHQQKHGFSDPNKFSAGVNGVTDRNSMSLVNLNWHDRFFWDGRANSLEQQALIPIQNSVEMGLTLNEAVRRLSASSTYQSLFLKAFGSNAITPDRIAKAIAQFERTLISGTSRYDLYKQGIIDLTEDEKQGELLFTTHPEPSLGIRGGNCGDCHTGALQRSNTFRNNGSDPTHSDIGFEAVTGNDADKGKMKTVSLRNIALTAPYMHDGRFSTLEEVLDHYNEHVDFDDPRVDNLIRGVSNQPFGQELFLTEKEKEQIVAFLKTLTDNSFKNDEKFSDPFK